MLINEFFYSNKVSVIEIILTLSIVFNLSTLCLNFIKSISTYVYWLSLPLGIWLNYPYDVVEIDKYCSFQSNNPVLIFPYVIPIWILFVSFSHITSLMNYYLISLRNNIRILVNITLLPSQPYFTMLLEAFYHTISSFNTIS